jgi:hypothetical protein
MRTQAPSIHLWDQAIRIYTARKIYAEVDSLVTAKHFRLLEDSTRNWLQSQQLSYAHEMERSRGEWKLGLTLLDESLEHLAKIHYRISDDENFGALCKVRMEAGEIFALGDFLDDLKSQPSCEESEEPEDPEEYEESDK